MAKQAVQRFGSYEDLEKNDVTIEEREEYEQHISAGVIVYAGVDYEAILRQVGFAMEFYDWGEASCSEFPAWYFCTVLPQPTGASPSDKLCCPGKACTHSQHFLYVDFLIHGVNSITNGSTCRIACAVTHG